MIWGTCSICGCDMTDAGCASVARHPVNYGHEIVPGLRTEIARLTAALSEAQRERDALKGEVERLTTSRNNYEQDYFRALVERDSAVKRAESAELALRLAHAAGLEIQDSAEAMLAAAVKRAEEAERQADGQGAMATGYRTSWLSEESKRLAAESRLVLAERVVEAAGTFVDADPSLCDHVMPHHEWDRCMDVLAALRSAVAEYRKAVGK